MVSSSITSASSILSKSSSTSTNPQVINKNHTVVHRAIKKEEEEEEATILNSRKRKALALDDENKVAKVPEAEKSFFDWSDDDDDHDGGNILITDPAVLFSVGKTNFEEKEVGIIEVKLEEDSIPISSEFHTPTRVKKRKISRNKYEKLKTKYNDLRRLYKEEQGEKKDLNTQLTAKDKEIEQSKTKALQAERMELEATHSLNLLKESLTRKEEVVQEKAQSLIKANRKLHELSAKLYECKQDAQRKMDQSIAMNNELNYKFNQAVKANSDLIQNSSNEQAILYGKLVAKDREIEPLKKKVLESERTQNMMGLLNTSVIAKDKEIQQLKSKVMALEQTTYSEYRYSCSCGKFTTSRIQDMKRHLECPQRSQTCTFYNLTTVSYRNYGHLQIL